MEAIIECCAGLDVHKKTVTACILVIGKEGKVEKSVKTFRTMTRDLLSLSDWLAEKKVTHIAMESTGVLWKPIYNILEDRFEVLLCNAKHIKQVPGRKTDVKDSEWIAQLLQHGLLSGSFIPPRPMRNLRDMTRHRAQLTSEKTREVNRIHKILEDANIKLAVAASDIMGKSGRDMIQALIAGNEQPEQMAELARGRMKNNIPELREALFGRVTAHHRYMLKTHFDHVLYLETVIEKLTERIEQLVSSQALNEFYGPQSIDNQADGSHQEKNPLPFEIAVKLLDEVPGIDILSAQDILAEIGTDMSQFPTYKNFTSWARISPGNHESAGKRKSGKTEKGNRWLKRTLSQVAWAASHTKETYLAAQYRRLAKRRGKKRAIIAVSHSILIIIYHMLKYHQHFIELGGDFFDRLDPERITRYHVKRLESFGFTVTLVKEPMAA